MRSGDSWDNKSVYHSAHAVSFPSLSFLFFVLHSPAHGARPSNKDPERTGEAEKCGKPAAPRAPPSLDQSARPTVVCYNICT